jgi:glycosyltransferase involved in cell wall biosynthesis
MKMGVRESNIHVIHPAIALPSKKFNERKKLNQPPVLFFLGYISYRKGLIFLIEALNMIKEKDWRLIVAGDTSQDPEYVERCNVLINKYGLVEKIEFTGMITREKINEYFSNSDIFIFPTLYEGYGMVIKEAASFGIPIITTNVSAIPYLVKNKESALLVPPEKPDAIKNAIIKLLEDEKLRKKISVGAYKTVNFSYNWKKAGERFLSIILDNNKSKV